LPPEAFQEVAPVAVDLCAGGRRLHGSVRGLTRWGLLQVKPAKFKPADLLDLWLRLVVLAAGDPAGAPQAAHLVAHGDRDTVVRHHLSAPSDPDRILAPLVELLMEGSRRPLPFFARCASELTRPVGSRVRTSPLARALAAWFGNQGSPGESADPWVARCFGRVEPHPLDDEFQALADRVFAPLWAHWTEEPA
ncbi:MAG: hypothetical protein J0L84_11295, partial [Verrucomicrobia bacterium]|nr:hypothetical protein [Verrucomicrobiota bacterium]